MQKRNEVVSHEGIVQSIDGDKVTVMMTVASACAGCHARHLCSSLDSRDKLVEAENLYHLPLEVGETLPDMVFRGEMTLDPGNCPVRIFQAEAPHTDDSTLVEVPGDKLLIMGDCTGGAFPGWEVDQELANKLAETIRQVNPETCLPGHWTPLSRDFIIQDLLYGE